MWRNETHENGQVDARRAPSGAGRSGRRPGASHTFEACAWDDGVAQVRLSLDVDRTFLFPSSRVPSTSATTLLKRTCASIGSMTRLAHDAVTSLSFEKKLPSSPPPPPLEKKLPDPFRTFSIEFIGDRATWRGGGGGGTYGTWRWRMASHGKVERRQQARWCGGAQTTWRRIEVGGIPRNSREVEPIGQTHEGTVEPTPSRMARGMVGNPPAS